MPRPIINLHRPTNLWPTFNRNMHRIVHVNVHAVAWTKRHSNPLANGDGSKGLYVYTPYIILSLRCMRKIMPRYSECDLVWICQWLTLGVHHDTASVQYLTTGVIKRISHVIHKYILCMKYAISSYCSQEWRRLTEWGSWNHYWECAVEVPGINLRHKGNGWTILDLIQPTS